MGKFFCPDCKVLTYSIRYIYNEKSVRPKDEPQYCRKCNTYWQFVVAGLYLFSKN